jgi:antitoxin ParD1/3/4
MKVSLTPLLEDLIGKKVQSGMYQSASEVVRKALRLLDEQDRLRAMRFEELRKEVGIGITAPDEGRSVVFDDAVVTRIEANGCKMLAERSLTKDRSSPS